VVINGRAAGVVRAARAEDRARTQRILQRLAEEGERVLPEKHLKFEGRLPTGGKGSVKVAVYAVRGHQLRIYGGFIGSKEGSKKVFACVDADIKKRDRADPERLKNAAKLLGSLLP
jgi:hypothetical protein